MTTHSQAAEKRERVLRIYESQPMTLEQLSIESGVPIGTIGTWRERHPFFKRRMMEILERNRALARQKPDFDGKIVFNPEREMPPKPDFRTWRPTYTGRQVQPHQEAMVDAWEDKTNQRVIVLGPPGSGKDTTAGDICLNEVSDDRAKRVAWIMKGENFSRRRLSERLAPYLTDPRAYNYKPDGADSVKPTRSLITDYGPFKWHRNMVYPDGTRVPKTTWTKNEMYFVGSETLEADPNLWATGVEGQLYGARVDTMVMSDIWDKEDLKGMSWLSTLEWVKGTARTRLDDKGRLLILGTMLADQGPYVQLIEYLTGNARIIHQDGAYTKYSNGVATVIYPAIDYDHLGHEVSYWPAAFPLNSAYQMPDGKLVEIDDEWTDEQFRQYADAGAEYRQGLTQVREDDPRMFATMYQQDPPVSTSGEFTDTILDFCDDPTRTIGVSRPGTIRVLGVDPARSGGAAWALLDWDRKEGTITVVDFFFGRRLGVQGIKQQLLLDPIGQYLPHYVCYETNRESAVLEFKEIQDTLREKSVTLRRKHTSQNRGGKVAIEGTAQVSAMVFDMRNGRFRFPAATKKDQDRVKLVKQHFHQWDEKQTRREAPDGGHGWRKIEDDIVMAIWVAWLEIQEQLQSNVVKSVATRMPEVVKRVWRSHSPKAEPAAPSAPPVLDLRAVALGGVDAADS